jgi:hypothetical protein
MMNVDDFFASIAINGYSSIKGVRDQYNYKESLHRIAHLWSNLITTNQNAITNVIVMMKTMTALSNIVLDRTLTLAFSNTSPVCNKLSMNNHVSAKSKLCRRSF